MFTEAAGIRRQVLGADHPITDEKVRAVGCTVTVESKYKQVVLLNEEVKFEHANRTLDTYLSHTRLRVLALKVQSGFTTQGAQGDRHVCQHANP